MSRDQQRHTLALMGTPRSRRQLSLEGAGSIRRPAGWLLPNKPASPNGPVRRAARTPCWAGHRGTPRSPDASPGRGGAGAWREEAMMGRPFRHWATPHPRPPPRSAPHPQLWEELSGRISEATWAQRTAHLRLARLSPMEGAQAPRAMGTL